MRVLVLNYEYPPLGGGAGNATQYLLREFASDEELEIDLITAAVGPYREEQIAKNIQAYFVDIRKEGNLHIQSQSDLLRYSWQSWRLARRLKRRHQYDLVHAFFGIPSGVIARLLQLPYIVSLRGSDVPFYNQRFAFLDRFLFQHVSRWVWRGASVVIANSTQLADLAKHTAPGLEIPVIENGVDAQTFTPAADRKPGRTPAADQVVLCVSRLIRRKRIDLLLQALSGLGERRPVPRLVLAGDGDERAALEKQAEDLGIADRVEFRGSVPHNELPELYRSADLFVLPSENEGMSNTALEALASGLPLILSDTGGAAALTQGNGTVVPVNDVHALEQAIDEILADESLQRTYGQASAHKAQDYSWTSTAAQYKERYIDTGNVQ